MSLKTLEFKEDTLYLLDQRYLPLDIVYFQAQNYEDVALAIKDMVVRGAPAIGVAAAYGFYLAAKEYADLPLASFKEKMLAAGNIIKRARPTAVNLVWAVEEMEKLLTNLNPDTFAFIKKKLLAMAKKIHDEDIEANKKMALFGNSIVPQDANILTHCNTGSLACSGQGTALGVIFQAHRSHKNIKVFVNETRPRLQGAKLTAFELIQKGIAATLIVDSASAVLMRDGQIDLVLVGADRIAANGDTANKIGTYMVSELAKTFNIPFYIVAPFSTIDFATSKGSDIIIEERSAEEITHVGDFAVAAQGVDVFNPAFDVTPAKNISGIITDRGIIKKPYEQNLTISAQEIPHPL